MANGIRAINAKPIIINKQVSLDQEFKDRACLISRCDNEAPEGISTMLCIEHLRLAWASYELLKGTDADTFREVPKARVSPRNHSARGFVYFAQVGRYVKIGWASNVDRRMKTLGASEVYYTFPGTRADEKAMHKTFHKYLADGAEYFHPVPVLMNYIMQLKTEAA